MPDQSAIRASVIGVCAVVLALGPILFVSADSGTNPAATGDGQARVLQGIPAIARAFAPIYGVKWQDYANVLAGICAVESNCNPTYPHWVTNSAGSRVYSQYQGLFQMNAAEVAKARQKLAAYLPKMEAAATDDETKKAVEFVKKAMQSAESSGGDTRFHPEYGVIIGAAKHIELQPTVERQYPGDPVRQAAAHMLAQFSGITEGKIRSGQFGAPISGSPNGDVTTSEAAALSVNKVRGASTVAQAVEAAGYQYGSKMQAMMQKMSQLTNGLTTVPDSIAPFAAPAYDPGVGPILNRPYSGVSELMETGYIPPTPAPAMPTMPPMSIPNSSGSMSQTSGTTGTQTSTSASSSSDLSGLIETIRRQNAGSSAEGRNAGPSVGFMYIGPRSIAGNERVRVSWTSVNMHSSGCTVTHESAVIGKGAEGTIYLRARALPRGSYALELRCVSPDGTIFTQADAVMVE